MCYVIAYYVGVALGSCLWFGKVGRRPFFSSRVFLLDALCCYQPGPLSFLGVLDDRDLRWFWIFTFSVVVGLGFVFYPRISLCSLSHGLPANLSIEVTPSPIEVEMCFVCLPAERCFGWLFSFKGGAFFLYCLRCCWGFYGFPLSSAFLRMDGGFFGFSLSWF